MSRPYKLDCSMLMEYANAHKVKKEADKVFAIAFSSACTKIMNERPLTTQLTLGGLENYEKRNAFLLCKVKYEARIKARKIFGHCKSAILLRGRKLNKELSHA